MLLHSSRTADIFSFILSVCIFFIGLFIFVGRFSQMQIYEIPVSVREEYSSII